MTNFSEETREQIDGNEIGVISVDTLRLYIPGNQYRISDKPDLYLGPESNGYLWTDSSGDAVRGECAFWNGDSVNVKLKAISINPSLPPICLVKFSAPKGANGHNAYPINAAQLVGALRDVESILASLGIETDIMNATVSRVDFFRDVELTNKITCYLPVLRSLFVSHVKKRHCIGSTVAYYNKQRAVVFYDKALQMTEKGHDRLRQPLLGNILRCEYRLKTSSAVQKHLNPIRKGKKIGAILVYDLVAEYDVLRRYHEIESQKLFNWKQVNVKGFRDCEGLSVEEIYVLQAKHLVKNYGTRAQTKLSMLRNLEQKFQKVPINQDNRNQLIADILKKEKPKYKQSDTRSRRMDSKLLQIALLPSGELFVNLHEELSKKLCNPHFSIVKRDPSEREPLHVPGDEDTNSGASREICSEGQEIQRIA